MYHSIVPFEQLTGLVGLSVSVKWLAVKTASEMTSIVSVGGVNLYCNSNTGLPRKWPQLCQLGVLISTATPTQVWSTRFDFMLLVHSILIRSFLLGDWCIFVCTCCWILFYCVYMLVWWWGRFICGFRLIWLRFRCLVLCVHCTHVRWVWWDWQLAGWLTTLLHCFDTVSCVIRPVKNIISEMCRMGHWTITPPTHM